MSFTFRKKASGILFNPGNLPAKKSSMDKKVEKIINDTIKEKIFNLLNINRIIYIKLIEYFPIFTTDEVSGEKSVKSLMMRLKNNHGKFREILAKEIQISGINMIEFNAYLEINGAKEVFNYEQQLENL